VRYALGVDVGGTFTDAVAADDAGRIVSAKTPSTPPAYERGVMNAIRELADALDLSLTDLLANTEYIAHGTTASINALVQGKVAPVGLITTKGHRDSIYIMNAEGRVLGCSAHEIQDSLRRRKPRPLMPKQQAKEVTERIDYAGDVLVALDEGEARQAIRELLDAGIHSIAVSLLWSFRNPVHERRIRELVHEVAPDTYVTLSSEVSPRIREFARTSTTVMNAQVGPRMRAYLGPLAQELEQSGLTGPLLVMQSSGGTVAAEEAPKYAISTVGSVLSGGVIGGLRLADQLGHRNVITTDVGGTTFLAGLIVEGEPVTATSTIVNQYPINTPTLRVHTIGSGGGAIAYVDQGGNLRVGPESAEAVPGPACYDQGGTRPTNTDANLVLGILSERGLLGGRKPLRRDLAEQAIREHIAEPLGLSTEDAAAAIYEIQNAQAGDLLRQSVVEVGHDPRDFTVYAFGGGGPAHCAGYARELGVREIVVPLGPIASAFSAYGLAASDVTLTAETSDPSRFPADPERVAANFARLEQELRAALGAQQLQISEVRFQREVDLRYSMQVNEVSTPVRPGDIDAAAVQQIVEDFEALYARINGPGAGFAQAGIQVITYRMRAIAELPFSVSLPEAAVANEKPVEAAIVEHRQVCLDIRAGYVETPIYDYTQLAAGHEITGPAVVEVPTTTVVVPPEVSGRVDHLGNLVMTYA
jgi:N-methylhydantoinase A